MGKKKPIRAEVKAAAPAQEITLANLDIDNIPPGGVVVRLDNNQVIADPNQPRTTFKQSEMEELKESLASQGQKQYPKVNWWKTQNGVKLFVIDDGERRWRCYRDLRWKDALYIVQQEPFKEGFDLDRFLGQGAANTGAHHTVGDLVRFTKRIVQAEVESRKSSGTTEHGAIQIALTRIDKTFGKKPGWSRNYHNLGGLNDDLLKLLDGDETNEAPLKWGDAISLVTAPKAEQVYLYNEARRQFPNDSHARRTFITQRGRKSREEKGEKVRGRGYDSRQRFLSYSNQLQKLAEKMAEGRKSQEHIVHIEGMLSKMSISDIERFVANIKAGLAGFTTLVQKAETARAVRLEMSGLSVVKRVA